MHFSLISAYPPQKITKYSKSVHPLSTRTFIEQMARMKIRHSTNTPTPKKPTFFRFQQWNPNKKSKAEYENRLQKSENREGKRNIQKYLVRNPQLFFRLCLVLPNLLSGLLVSLSLSLLGLRLRFLVKWEFPRILQSIIKTHTERRREESTRRERVFPFESNVL